jgi:hypothetical protein
MNDPNYKEQWWLDTNGPIWHLTSKIQYGILNDELSGNDDKTSQSKIRSKNRISNPPPNSFQPPIIWQVSPNTLFAFIFVLVLLLVCIYFTLSTSLLSFPLYIFFCQIPYSFHNSFPLIDISDIPRGTGGRDPVQYFTKNNTHLCTNWWYIMEPDTK